MRTRLARIFVGALAAFLLLVTFAPDALSQRKRTSRRATNPVRVRTSPTPDTTSGEPSVVSTADEQDETPRRTTTRRQQQQQQQRDNSNAQAETDHVRALSTQVEQLNGQLNQMKADQRAMYDLERLTRAEQRAEDLRRQLREITDKEFQYQERLAEIDYESRPDAIQSRAALIGSLNPSVVRDAIAQQLERERVRIQKQLELLAASHTRLDAAVASADAEVERLRQRVDAADAAQQSAPAPDAATTGTANPAPQPSPSPTPAQPPGSPQ